MHDFGPRSRSVSESSHPVQILPKYKQECPLTMPIENRGETGKVDLCSTFLILSFAHYSCNLMQYAGHLWQGGLHWSLAESLHITAPVEVCLKAVPTYSRNCNYSSKSWGLTGMKRCTLDVSELLDGSGGNQLQALQVPEANSLLRQHDGH